MLAEGRGERVTTVVEFALAGEAAARDVALAERVLGRWTHKKSGRTYHPRFNPPASLATAAAAAAGAGEGAAGAESGAQPAAGSMLDDETHEPLERAKKDLEVGASFKKKIDDYAKVGLAWCGDLHD